MSLWHLMIGRPDNPDPVYGFFPLFLLPSSGAPRTCTAHVPGKRFGRRENDVHTCVHLHCICCFLPCYTFLVFLPGFTLSCFASFGNASRAQVAPVSCECGNGATSMPTIRASCCVGVWGSLALRLSVCFRVFRSPCLCELLAHAKCND